jgi:hypothetical protein
VLRTAAGELLSADDIAGRIIAAKGFDAADGILRTAIRDQVGSIRQTAAPRRRNRERRRWACKQMEDSQFLCRDNAIVKA